MEEIKSFIAWDLKNQKWIGRSYSETLCVGDQAVVLITQNPDGLGSYDSATCRQLTNAEIDDLEIGEFIGICDKDGAEIYDINILKFREYVFRAEKDKQTGNYYIDEKYGLPEYLDWAEVMVDHRGSVKIIGNVFENFELLGKGE